MTAEFLSKIFDGLIKISGGYKRRLKGVSAKKSGFLITFEGGEGTGKSTQLTLLAEYLRGLGYEVVVTREPGGTKGADIIRHVLLSGAAEKYGSHIETLLFAAARADHIDELIAPSLQEGKIVLCDRFIDSTRVYQGGEGDDAMIATFGKIATGGIRPDLTFILDLPAIHGLARANARRAEGEAQDRFEKEQLDIHERRRQAFLTIARQEKERCIVIDANREVTMIARDIAVLTKRRLK